MASHEAESVGVFERRFLQDPHAAGYTPRERKAILEHYFYEIRAGGDRICVEEILCRWESGPAHKWRQEKARRDGEDQAQEILRHKWLESEKRGYDVGEHTAAVDWVIHHAGPWREHREGQLGMSP